MFTINEQFTNFKWQHNCQMDIVRFEDRNNRNNSNVNLNASVQV